MTITKLQFSAAFCFAGVPHRCMYHPLAAASPPARQVTEGEAEMERIVGRCVKKNVQNTVHIVFLGCSNDLRPVLCLVFQRGATQGCNCTVLWLAGIS